MYPPSKYSPEYDKPWKPENNSGCGCNAPEATTASEPKLPGCFLHLNVCQGTPTPTRASAPESGKAHFTPPAGAVPPGGADCSLGISVAADADDPVTLGGEAEAHLGEG